MEAVVHSMSQTWLPAGEEDRRRGGEEDMIHAFSIQTSLDPKPASSFEKSQLVTDV